MAPPIILAIILAPQTTWWVTLLLFVLQFVVVNVLAPKVMSQNIGIHPLLVFAAILAGTQVAQGWGAIFGVPVVAWRQGAMPEIVDEGETGFVVDTIEAAVEAVTRCDGLDRDHIRQVFERRFSAERMISDYEAVYRTLAGTGRNPAGEVGSLAGSERLREMR